MPKVTEPNETAIAPTEAELTELIQLHSGAQVIKKRLKAAAFYEFQGKQTSLGGADAVQWITMQMFELLGEDGKRSPLTIDVLEDEMEFEDAAQMSSIINSSVLPYIGANAHAPTDGDIKLPSGLTVSRRKMKAKVFYQFQDKVAKDGSAAAMQWVTFHAFEAESGGGKVPLTPAMVEDLYFEDAAILTAVISKLFTAYLERKTS